MPAHVVYGDTFLVSAEVLRIKAEAGAQDLMDSNRQRVVASDAVPAEVVAMCGSLPFLDSVRLIELEGALATQESTASGRSRGGGRGRRTRRGGGPEGWSQVVAAIPDMPPTTLLILTDGVVSDGNPLLRELRDQATVHKQTAPSGQGLDQWIKRSAEEKGANISPPAIRAISEMVGNDLWALDRELEKLSLFTGDKAISEYDVKEMVPYAQEANIFTAVDAIVAGRGGDAMQLLRRLLGDGREPQYIAAMIERQLRLLAIARDLIDRGVDRGDMGRRLGTNSDFVVRKTLEQARRMSMHQIVQMYERLLRSDVAVKRGELEPAISLELLVAELATMYSGTPSRRR